MNLSLIGFIIITYFAILFIISYLTGKKTDNDTFFLGNRKSPWYIVAIGMIGASLSGVTFISVPGWVNATGFTYMQMVFGYLIGYIIIANVLLPLYYRLNLTSIYTYLDQRFGFWSYKSGATLFIISKTVGSAARLYLMASVLQLTIFDHLNIPFVVTAIVSVLLIWLYTHKGGMKTIIWTDTIQAIIMILCVIVTIGVIIYQMDLTLLQTVDLVMNSKYAKVFEFNDWHSSQHFLKQVLTGAFVTLCMTGLDQDMMQKNLTCRSLKDSQKNMYWYSLAFIPINFIFLALGAILYIFASQHNIVLPARADEVFPFLATGNYLPPIVGILFMLGLIAAAYSSADSALASLTTSFSIDILCIERMQEKKAIRTRSITHIGFSILLIAIILVFKSLNLDTIISTILNIAGYTYGPLLGLYVVGLFTKINPRDYLVPIISIASPIMIGIMDFNSVQWFGFSMGYEKLMYNAILVIIGLVIISIKNKKQL